MADQARVGLADGVEIGYSIRVVVRWLSEKKAFSDTSASNLANNLNWTVPQLKLVILDIMDDEFPSKAKYLKAKDRLGIKDLNGILGNDVYKDDEFIDLLTASRALHTPNARTYNRYIQAGGPAFNSRQLTHCTTISKDMANKIFTEYERRNAQASQPSSPWSPVKASAPVNQPVTPCLIKDQHLVAATNGIQDFKITTPANQKASTGRSSTPTSISPTKQDENLHVSGGKDEAETKARDSANQEGSDRGQPSTLTVRIASMNVKSGGTVSVKADTAYIDAIKTDLNTLIEKISKFVIYDDAKIRVSEAAKALQDQIETIAKIIKNQANESTTDLRIEAIARIIKHWQNYIKEEGETRDPAFVDCGPLPDIIALPEAVCEEDYYRGKKFWYHEKRLIPTTHNFFQNTNKDVAMTVRNDWTAEQVNLKFPDDTIDGMDGDVGGEWKTFFETFNDRTLIVKVTPKNGMTFHVCAAHLKHVDARARKKNSFRNITKYLDLYAKKEQNPVIFVGDMNLNLTDETMVPSEFVSNLSPPRSNNGAPMSACDPYRTYHKKPKAPIDYVVTTDSSTIVNVTNPHITSIEHVLTIQVSDREVVVIKNEDGVAEDPAVRRPTVDGSQGRLTDPILKSGNEHAQNALDHDPIIADVTLSKPLDGA